MKQYVTTDQILELSFEERHTLADWVAEKGFVDKDHQLTLSIGQMIEFLDEEDSFYTLHAPDKNNSKYDPQGIGHEDDEAYWDDRDMSNPYWWQVEMNRVGSYSDKELVDALWSAVKEILERDKQIDKADRQG